MVRLFNRQAIAITLLLASAVSACRSTDTLSTPDNFVNFETASQGIGATENSIVIKVTSTEAAAADIPVVVNLTEGSNAALLAGKYLIQPQPVAGKIHLVIPSGNNEASLTVSKTAGALFDGDEKLTFDIYSSGTPLIIGNRKQLVLTFGELVSLSATGSINGGGTTYPNKVFIDLSANRNTEVLRSTWDLGFYTGNDYRVILNSSAAMMARQINKNDLNAVTAADTLGFSGEVIFNQTAPTTSSLAYIDYPDGDLSKTAIASVSATASENKVYIINRGKGIGTPAPDRGWKKVRIIRNASGGYSLQYADIAATSFTSVDIAKDDSYNFKYISFETGAVNVEPMKKKWDLAWTYFSNVTNFGTGEVPYLFQDVIILNRGVAVAKVMTATRSFADFSAADITGQTFLTTQNAIASDWRSGGGPSSGPAIRTDRFYIVKDNDANYYKIRFTSLTNGNGERGYPSYEAIWLKKD